MSLDGYFVIKLCTIYGWAWDNSKPNEPVTVEVYDSECFLSIVVADLYQHDLYNAGKGNGEHGFVFNVMKLSNSYKASISIKIAGTNFFLHNIPSQSSIDTLTHHNEYFTERISGKFCPMPFDRFELEVSGNVYLCCPTYLPVIIGNAYKMSLEEIWNSDTAKEIRRSIVDGEFKYCSDICPTIQNGSLPNRNNLQDTRHKNAIKSREFVLPYEPVHLSLLHDRTCNLSCPSCRNELYSATGKEEDSLKSILDSVILPMLGSLKILKIAGGELFASKHLQEVVASIDRQQHPNLRLGILTNGTLFNKKQWDKICNVHGMIRYIWVSLDAAYDDTFRELRRGAILERVMPNLEFISSLRKGGEIEEFGILFVVQSRNFREMKDFVKLGKRLGCDIVKFFQLVDCGTYPTGEFEKRSVVSKNHPQHQELLEILRNPIFDDHIVDLGNLCKLRNQECKMTRQLQINISSNKMISDKENIPYFFYTDKRLDKNLKYVLLLGGFTGYQNFGDILQLKYAIDFHKKNTSLIPVVLCDIESITDEGFIKKLYIHFDVEHIIFFSKTLYDTNTLPIRIINEEIRIKYFHTYGGGFLVEFWLDWYLNLAPSILDFFGVGHYVLSGQQLDRKATERLKVHFDKYKPLLIGCRDEESYNNAKKIAPDIAEYSFDDAFECMCDITRHIKIIENQEKTQTILLHLNLSSYVHSTTIKMLLGTYKDALESIKEHFKDRKIDVILIIAMNDSRTSTILDTPAALQLLEDSFNFKNIIINLANITLSYHPDTQEEYFFEIPCNSVMITSSYHTAMLGLVLKIPTFLFSNNAYYEQKHKGLHLKGNDIKDFLDKLPEKNAREGPGFFQKVREKWQSKLKDAYKKEPEPKSVKPRSYDETEEKEFTYKLEKYDLHTALQNTQAHIRNLENTLAQKDEDLKKKEKHIQNLKTAITRPDLATPDGVESPVLVGYNLEDGPLVSVIMPTYNRSEMLKEALKSVLCQTYKNYEIIVINDAGEDVSGVIESLDSNGKIVYLQHKENRGLPAARNTGLKEAKGKYIAYLDDDDIYYQDHLETLIEFLETNNYKVAYTDAYQAFQTWITDKYVITGKELTYSYDFDRQKLLVSNYIPVLSVIHGRDILEIVGLFDETLDAHEDWDLWIRISQKYDFHHIQKTTAEFRSRSDGTTMTSIGRMSFLKTLRVIHSRYSHSITDPCILEDRKRAEEFIAREVEIGEKAYSVKHYEYLHRYMFAKEFVKGKNVLDVSCDEGYGSFILSKVAKSVTSIDMDIKSIKYASSRYIKENLKFVKYPINDINIKEEKIFDVIVCFGALGPVEQHDKLMREVKRLITDDGIFIASIPNKGMCSDQTGYQPLRINKLYLDEFKALLKNNFENTIIFGQKLFPSSNIFNLSGIEVPIKEFAIEKGDKEFFIVPPEKKEVRDFIAVSSDAQIEKITGDSYLVDISETLFKHKNAFIDNLDAKVKERGILIKRLEEVVRDKDAHAKNLDEAIRNKDTHVRNLEDAIRNKDAHVRNLDEAIRNKDARIKNLEEVIRDKDTLVDILDIEVRDKDTHINNLEDKLRDKEGRIENFNKYIGHLEVTIKDKDVTLNNIYSSHGWKVLLSYYNVRNKLFPLNSKRRFLSKIVYNAIINPRGLFRDLNKTKDNEKK